MIFECDIISKWMVYFGRIGPEMVPASCCDTTDVMFSGSHPTTTIY